MRPRETLPRPVSLFFSGNAFERFSGEGCTPIMLRRRSYISVTASGWPIASSVRRFKKIWPFLFIVTCTRSVFETIGPLSNISKSTLIAISARATDYALYHRRNVVSSVFFQAPFLLFSFYFLLLLLGFRCRI